MDVGKVVTLTRDIGRFKAGSVVAIVRMQHPRHQRPGGRGIVWVKLGHRVMPVRLSDVKEP